MAAVVMALMGEGGDCCAYGGDPVNLATGNFIYAYDYLAFDSRPRMSLRLFYNSHGRGTSPLGMGTSSALSFERWIRYSFFAYFVRKFAASTAALPPPMTAITLS